MQITIFGASGKVGLLVVEQALTRGYSVVAFVHSHDMFVPSNKLRVIKGDIYQAADVAAAIKGSVAVISCLGSWGTPRRNVLTSAMQALVPAMERQGIKRLVTLTGSGAVAPDIKPGQGYKLMLKLLAPFPAGKVFRDGEQHMKVLATSTLDWTTIRSPIMTSFGRGTYQLNMKAGGLLATIPRRAVVAALLDQLELSDNIYAAPILHCAKRSSIGQLPPAKV